MKVNFHRNTSSRRWGRGTLPAYGPGGRRQTLLWVGPVFIRVTH